MMLYTEITTCRSCQSSRLEDVLDLGMLAVSDFILPGGEEHYAPLELICCAECGLVQLRHTVERDFLYRERPYGYKSGINESMVAALEDVVNDAIWRVDLQPGDSVCDVGANDGTLLGFYPGGINRYGYEPSTALAGEASQKTGATICLDYFPPRWLRPARYKVITAIAQFYNVNDPNAYLAAIKEVLHPEGVWIVQYQDLESMLETEGLDNVCHEHVLYLHQESFQRMLDRHGLYIDCASWNQVNGKSVRYIVKHGQRAKTSPIRPPDMSRFKRQAERNKEELLYLLRQLKADGKTVCGVAASTKFNTLSQWCGITPDLLPAIADRNPDKVGKVTVGTHIPIISEEELFARKPDVLLACAWQFLGSFQERYKTLTEAGAKWLVPLPHPRIMEVNHADLLSSDSSSAPWPRLSS